MATKRTARKGAAAPVEGGTPSQVVAREIMAQFRDLTPSVNKIMGAELAEPACLHAITVFRNSLGVVGDPMRDPANAILAGRALVTDAS